MKVDGYITFEEFPVRFKPGKTIRLMQYEFSGIQSFIFGNVDVRSTRSQIRAKSEYVANVTDTMRKWIEKRLGLFSGFEVLSQSSGKLICAVSKRVSVEKIIQISNEIQRMIYVSTEGKLELYYGVIMAMVVDSSERVLEKNGMSALALKVNENKYHCTNIVGLDMLKEPDKSCEELHYNEAALGDEPWVAIKLDLDNLGSFFQKVIELDKRKRASNVLAEVLENAFAGVDDVIPIFNGGDDIFAIAKKDSCLSVIKYLYNNIKEGIEKKEELALYREVWGISGGCSLIRNDLGNVPLLYYFESSEEQLEKAKDRKRKNVLSVYDVILNWEQLQTLESVYMRNRVYILAELDKEQQMAIETNVRELKARIVSLNRWSEKKLMSSEEERIVNSII